MSEMTKQPASPVCYLADASDLYSGYASADEITVALDQLLAKAAAAEVAVAAFRQKCAQTEAAEFLQHLSVGEERASFLLRQVADRFGIEVSGNGSADTKAGDSQNLSELLGVWKAMTEELAAFLPRVRDDRLHAELRKIRIKWQGQGERLNALLVGQEGGHKQG